MLNIKFYLLPIFTAFLFLMVPETSQAKNFDLDLRVQMGFGGDTVASVSYSDGSDSDLKLGTAFNISAGGITEIWKSGESSIDIEALAGWSTWSTGPENTDDRLSFSRFPFEILGFYKYQINEMIKIRAGGGAVYSIAGGIKGSGSLDNIDIDIENNTGWTAEAGLIYEIYNFGIKYTGIEYEVEGVSDPMDGSSFAVFFGFLF